ncbi:hypothetical protein [Sphingomonas sp.]|uniref:hypothetical protein n=1 Tax=Sphingomonas sp. TaxID=28214 RepID=UPI003B00E8AB
MTQTAEYRLPDGGVARVRYAGDVPPRLIVVPAGELAAASPFAMLDQVAAMMNARANAMFAQITDIQQAAPRGAVPARVPAGVQCAGVSPRFRTVFESVSRNGCTATTASGAPAASMLNSPPPRTGMIG